MTPGTRVERAVLLGRAASADTMGAIAAVTARVDVAALTRLEVSRQSAGGARSATPG